MAYSETVNKWYDETKIQAKTYWQLDNDKNIYCPSILGLADMQIAFRVSDARKLLQLWKTPNLNQTTWLSILKIYL